MFKNRTLVEADPGSLPAAMMELFVTLVYGSKPYVIVTRSSILNVCRGPRPSFDYSGILYNSNIA